MSDLVKRLRARLPYLRNKADRAYFAAAIDALAALIAAGDKLAGYAVHDWDCEDMTGAYPGSCSCGYTEAWKAWKKEST